MAHYSYKYGSGRARSERVRIILESILIDMSQNLHRFPTHERPGYILIGHSQGGAAISQVMCMRFCSAEVIIFAAVV